MDNFEVNNCLQSMSILIDTRERPTGRQSEQRYNAFKCDYRRQKLNYGDYTYNCILPSGEPLHAAEGAINPDVVIERKMNLAELSQCFCQDRERFTREMQRATDHGAKVYLLVEGASYENILNGKYKTRFNPQAFTASLFAFMARYNVVPVFCKAETSGRVIKEILYRELKERLTNGLYDKRQSIHKDL